MSVGEAEPVFHRILADLDAGCLKGVYKADRLCDMDTLPSPRTDLIKRMEAGRMAGIR